MFDGVQLKFCSGGGVVTPSKPLSPHKQLSPLSTPGFKMFLEISLNDPALQASFTATTSPSTTPSNPHKNFNPFGKLDDCTRKVLQNSQHFFQDNLSFMKIVDDAWGGLALNIAKPTTI